MENKRTQTGIIIALITLALDQLSKWAVLVYLMQPPQVIEITPFFNVVFAWNKGVSFGMFNNTDVAWSGWILSALAMVIVLFLANWLRKAETNLLAFALAAIIGGAIGNVIDRFVHGAVYDFLDVHVAGYHWPAFNIADSGITIGATILILDSLFRKSDNSKDNDSSEKS